MRPWRAVALRQPDLDTVVAGFVLGVEPDLPVWPVTGEAPAGWLADPGVLCLECGGSGQTDLGNFDHHGEGAGLPPACVQALGEGGGADAWTRDLVAYAAAVDEGRPPPAPRVLPDVSTLVSGIRLVHGEAAAAFRAGLQLLHECRGLPPWGPLPRRSAWMPYLDAKAENLRALLASLDAVRTATTRSGRTLAYLETPAAGGHEALRRTGAAITVLSRPLDGGRRKYTVASRTLRVADYLPRLRAAEPGWGGPSHGTIIGSPFSGSLLSPDDLIALLLDDLSLRPADPVSP